MLPPIQRASYAVLELSSFLAPRRSGLSFMTSCRIDHGPRRKGRCRGFLAAVASIADLAQGVCNRRGEALPTRMGQF